MAQIKYWKYLTVILFHYWMECSNIGDHHCYSANQVLKKSLYFTKLWKDLPENHRDVDLAEIKLRLKLKYKLQKCKFYSYECKQCNKLVTCLRLEHSFFNSDSFSFGFFASPYVKTVVRSRKLAASSA